MGASAPRTECAAAPDAERIYGARNFLETYPRALPRARPCGKPTICESARATLAYNNKSFGETMPPTRTPKGVNERATTAHTHTQHEKKNSSFS